MKTLTMALSALLLTSVTARADLPAYHADSSVSGTIRIWGTEGMTDVVNAWEKGFQKLQPGVKFEVNLKGTATSMPPLYLGLGDLALFGRETNTTDNDGFLHVTQYRPVQLELMNGSLDKPGKSYALVVYVHKDNPLAKLSLAQLQRVFGNEGYTATAPAKTWGELGLTGKWRDQPINLYTFDAETGTGVFFEHAVLHDSRKMNWEHLTEFHDIKTPDGKLIESGRQIVDALAEDPNGIAISGLRYAVPAVKPVALAESDGATASLATEAGIMKRTYPLARRTYAYANQPPGKPLDPKVKEFLRYTLSREGQQIVRQQGGYLPLSPETAEAQLKVLE